MKPETIIEVMEKLIGDVDALGNFERDSQCYENLQTLEKVLYHFTDKVITESYCAGSYMGSVARNGQYAKKVVKKLKAQIDDALGVE